MKTDETDVRIALQPETDVEQALLAELFTRLSNLSDAPEHPEKVGTEQVFYTLDVAEYDLDGDLWERADCRVNQHGRLDPEPGSRALVVVHGEAPEPEPADDESSHATQEDIEQAVEAVATADEDGDDNEYTEDIDDLLGDLDAAMPLDDSVEYEVLQDFAKRISTTGRMDIPANQSTDDLIDDIETFYDRENTGVEA